MNKPATIFIGLMLPCLAFAQQEAGPPQAQAQSGQQAMRQEQEAKILQQRKPARPQPEPLVYAFQHLDRGTAGAVTHLANEVLNLTGTYDSTLGVAYFRKFGPEGVDGEWKKKALEFLKRYDVAPPSQAQVHYLAYLVLASNGAPPGNEKLNPIPKELDDAIAEMKGSLNYARYDLLTSVASVSEGGASITDMLPGDQYRRRYTIEYGHVSVAPDRKSVAIHPFQFRLEASGATQYVVVSSISSDVTVHLGQKLVLGKVRLGDNSDIFVILTATVE